VLEVIMAVFIGGVFFWLLMLTDWYFHEPIGTDRTIWLILIVLLNVVGAFAYLCLRYRYNRRRGMVLSALSIENQQPIAKSGGI